MKTNIILLCILIFLLLIYLNNTKSGSREGLLTVTNPLVLKLTDENITKIYKAYCDKFPNSSMPLDDWKRQQSIDALIGDAKSWAFGDTNRVNACYINPPITPVAGESLTDDLRTKIYKIFCNTPITLTTAQKAMTFDQLWVDAQSKTC